MGSQFKAPSESQIGFCGVILPPPPPTPTASFSHKLLAMILLKLKFKINPFPQQTLGQVGELALGSTSEKKENCCWPYQLQRWGE